MRLRIPSLRNAGQQCASASVSASASPQPSAKHKRATHPQLSRMPAPVCTHVPTRAQDLCPLSTDEKKWRVQMLHDLHASQQRPLDAEKAKDAFKLRKFAEARYRKDVFSRLTHKVPLLRPAPAQLEALKTMDVDLLIDQIKKGTLRGNRTLLTDVAEHHLMTALNFDRKAYEKGVRHMAAWEGVHSTAGRGVTFAGSCLAFGAAPAVAATGSAAANSAAKAMKFLSHQLPTSVVNPFLTGILRIGTDIRKSSRNGGISKVAKNIDNVAAMREIRADIGHHSSALKKLLDQRHAPENTERLFSGRIVVRQDYVQKICTAFAETYAAQAAYKERLGSTKAHTWSKGYGMGVNAVAATAQATGIAFPPAIPVSLSVQALCIPLQLGAGYLDMHTAQRYNFRVSMKYGRILTPEAQHLPAEKLQASHIDMARLRELFQPAEVQKLELVREVYADELGELHFAKDRVEQALKKLAPGAHVKHSQGMSEKRAEFSRLSREIQQREVEVRQFESMTEDSWAGLPLDSTIGRCLDNHQFLVKKAQEARKRKPGEVAAQVWQRYKQLYGDGPASLGVLMPTLDLSLNLDNNLAEHHHAERPAQEGIPAGIGAGVGVANFTAGTGIVRAGKAQDKRALARAIKAKEVLARREALQAAWVVPLDDTGKTIDLSHTGGFDRTLHTRPQRVWRFVRIMPHGLFASQRALYQTVRARHARQQANETLKEAVTILNLQNRWRAMQPLDNLSVAGLKEEFLALPQMQKRKPNSD